LKHQTLVLWFLVVLGFWNIWAGHEEKRAALRDYRAGQKLDASLAFRLARAYATDDDDTQRYLAYCNALLGRPYSPFFVKSASEWQAAGFAFDANGVDDAIPVRGPPLVPYRDYVVEYPPAFFVFSLPPALLTADVDTYRLLFSLEMATFLTLSLWLCGRLRSDRPGSWGWATAMVLSLGVVTVRRYDPGVAFLTVLALWAAVSRRPYLAGAALATAGAAKLVPLVLWPLCARKLGRLWLPFLLATAVVSALWLAPAQPYLSQIVSFHGQRPLQLESSAAGVLGLTFPGQLEQVWSYGSANVAGPYTNLARQVSVWLALSSGLAIYFYLWLRPVPPVAAAGSLLAIPMALGPVFSPQYLVWLLPIGCHFGRRAPFLAALALTQLIFPILYGYLQAFHPLACSLLLVRNGLVLWWGLGLLKERQT